MKRIVCLVLVVLTILAIRRTASAAAQPFFIKNGDRVCFYGDSITEQRFYPVDVETYIRTRFPNLKVSFVDAGVGGDRVGGGWAGPIDLRLKRDVFPFKPNVVTIMLGMNDFEYRPFNQHIFDVYCKGYEHIIASLQTHLPGVRIILIEPSPFDDVTHASTGKNNVLVRYSQFVKTLAAKNHLVCVDFNTTLVDVLQKAEKINPALALKIIPGRVHPSAAGQLVMAQALLQGLGATATVTAVTINAQTHHIAQSVNTTITNLADVHGGISWTQHDNALPMPILSLHAKWPQFPPVNLWAAPAPDMRYTNAATAMTIKLSGFIQDLDQQPLCVTHLSAAHYELKINGRSVGVFSADELSSGINLSQLPTPMLSQAYQVMALVWQRTETWFTAWRQVELPMANFGRSKLILNTNVSAKAAAGVDSIMSDFSKLENIVDQRSYLAAQPVDCHYELMPVLH